MLNSRAGIFHPSFFYHARPAVESAQVTRIEVYAPTGEVAKWTPGSGMGDNLLKLVWVGHGRLQPDKDWRARAKDQGNEHDAVQAVRIQLPIGQNEHDAVRDAAGKIITYGPDPLFAKDFVVRATETYVIGTEELLHRDYYVRNALPSGNAWLYNLLCDTGTK